MHRVYGVAIWSAIGMMFFGLSMLFGFWAVLVVAVGVGASGALLHARR